MKVLKVELLSKAFAGIHALTNVSISLDVGEKRAIIGPNGAGKTTLINVISGLFPPSKGNIYLSGDDITKAPIYKRAHFGLARSFQVSSLFFEMTILDNVMLALQGKQFSWHRTLRSIAYPDDFVAEARKLLESSNFWERRNALAMALSHGEQRQLEIILSMVPGAKVLLLDEPSAGLSVAESAKLAEMIRNVPKDVAVLFSAHDLELVFGLADQITILHHGMVFTEGTPDQIHADEKVREIYLGENITEDVGAS
jgi:branched-chain amino acid transport system ATP-binding protein